MCTNQRKSQSFSINKQCFFGSRQGDPPSVNLCSKTEARSTGMAISPPSFRLLEDFDDMGNTITDPRKRRRLGLPCDGKTIYDDPSCVASQHEMDPSQHNLRSPNFDLTPGSIKGATDERIYHKTLVDEVDNSAPIILSSSQESPQTPGVQIIGAASFQEACTRTALDVDKIFLELIFNILAKWLSIMTMSALPTISWQHSNGITKSQLISRWSTLSAGSYSRINIPETPADINSFQLLEITLWISQAKLRASSHLMTIFPTASNLLTGATISLIQSFKHLFFPIYYDDHWCVFVVALQDGYFVFLDSFFDEDHPYQTEVRSVIVSSYKSC